MKDLVLLRLERASPRLPLHACAAWQRTLAAAALHAVFGGLLFLSALPDGPMRVQVADHATIAEPSQAPRVVFLARPDAPPARGGGGGGNRRRGVMPRAQAPGRDAVTLPIARAQDTAATRDPIRSDQQVALDARPLAAGMAFAAGLPDAVSSRIGDALGPGTGGGVGDGDGTGIGSGRGSGVGPGSGGGTGGGAYRPGGRVSAPVLLYQVRPTYTVAALQSGLRGSVVLEVVVDREGCPSQVRVVRSLDRGGLDDEAIAAVRQWRFRPGRLGGDPVDVLVTIIIDFNLY